MFGESKRYVPLFHMYWIWSLYFGIHIPKMIYFSSLGSFFYLLFHGQLPQNSTAPQNKVEPASENNTASNQSSDYVVAIKNIKECSEKGSDAQVSLFLFIVLKYDRIICFSFFNKE